MLLPNPYLKSNISRGKVTLYKSYFYRQKRFISEASQIGKHIAVNLG